MVREIPRGPEDATTKAILGIIAIGDEMTKIINLSMLSPKKDQVAA
jgi:purine-binding chemotaxis protein CheW